MRNVLLALAMVILPLQAMSASEVGGGDKPLLMPGKQSLYQRVLSVPGARIADKAGGQADKEVVPFTAFYVYAREQQGGREWVAVGTDRHGRRHIDGNDKRPVRLGVNKPDGIGNDSARFP